MKSIFAKIITTVKTDFLKLQKRVDITYLEALKSQLHTELQDDYTRYLKDRASRAIYEMKYNIESQKDITLVKDIRAVLPEAKVKSAMQAMRQVFTDSVIDKVYTCSFELDPKLPKITKTHEVKKCGKNRVDFMNEFFSKSTQFKSKMYLPVVILNTLCCNRVL